MPKWNKDISTAPKGTTKEILGKARDGSVTRKVLPVREWVMTYSKCGQFIYTHFLPEENRWNLYTVEQPPLAWLELDAPDV